MISLKHLFQLSVKSVKAWSDDFAPSMGAAISYYTVFSLPPLLIIVIAIAGAVFGREAVQGQLTDQMGGMIGDQGAAMIQGMVAGASDTGKGLVAGTISFVVLILGATTVFGELQSALDRIWDVPASEKPQGIWGMIRARFLSFGVILGLVFLLIVSLAASAGVAAFGALTDSLLPGGEVVLQVINFVVSIAIFTLLFAMIYKLMPTTKIEWRDVWVGGFTTSVLFNVGKTLIGLYLGKSNMSESFAAAGSVVVLLVWVYYAAQIFLLGAEFTKAFAQDHGSRAGAPASTTDTASSNASGKPTKNAPAASGSAVVPDVRKPGPTSLLAKAGVNATPDRDAKSSPVVRAIRTKADKSTHEALIKLFAELAVLAVVKVATTATHSKRIDLQKRAGWTKPDAAPKRTAAPKRAWALKRTSGPIRMSTPEGAGTPFLKGWKAGLRTPRHK